MKVWSEIRRKNVWHSVGRCYAPFLDVDEYHMPHDVIHTLFIATVTGRNYKSIALLAGYVTRVHQNAYRTRRTIVKNIKKHKNFHKLGPEM